MSSYVELHLPFVFLLSGRGFFAAGTGREGGRAGLPTGPDRSRQVWGSMELGRLRRGDRAITGTELTVEEGGRLFHLTLLVENETGYHNLCRLLTASPRPYPGRKGPAGRPAPGAAW